MAKVAVLVGSNYIGTQNQLGGCGNDVRDMGELLNGDGFTTTILTDVKGMTYSDKQPVSVAGMPNKDNILSALGNMIKSANPGDELIFVYSGHGTQMLTPLGKSKEDYLVPLDVVTEENENKLISSYDLHDLLLQVPHGVKLLMIADSCFSGNITKFDQNTKDLDLKKIKPFCHLRSLIDSSHRSDKPHGDLTLIAGCKANQESTDLGSNGALTAAIKEWINQKSVGVFLNTSWNYTSKEITLKTLKDNLTETIQNEGITTQNPQISYDKDTGVIASQPSVENTPAPGKFKPGFLNFLHGLYESVTHEPIPSTVLTTQNTYTPSLKRKGENSPKLELVNKKNEDKKFKII